MNLYREPDPSRIQQSVSGNYIVGHISSFDKLPTYILEQFGLQLTTIYEEGEQELFISKLKQILSAEGEFCSPLYLQNVIMSLITNKLYSNKPRTVTEDGEVEEVSEIETITESPFVKHTVGEPVQSEELVSEIDSLTLSPQVKDLQTQISLSKDVNKQALPEETVVETVTESVVDTPVVKVGPNLCVDTLVIERYKTNPILDFLPILYQFDGVEELVNSIIGLNSVKNFENNIKTHIKKISGTTDSYFSPSDEESPLNMFDKIHGYADGFNVTVKIIDILDYLIIKLINKYVEDCKKIGIVPNIDILNKVLKYVRSDKAIYPNEYFKSNLHLGEIYNRCK